MQKINSQIDEVMLVYPKGKRYYISPIKSAAYFEANDAGITYLSPSYKFKFDYSNGAIGENISYKNNRARVSFEGKLENECSGAYIFHQLTQSTANPYSDLVVVPEGWNYH